MKSRIALVLLLLCCIPASAGVPVTYTCAGLEAWDIRGTFDVDWAYGAMRNKRENLLFGFSFGSVQQAVPRVKRADFRTFAIEHRGSATIRSGFNVVDNEYQVTIIGAPLSVIGPLNLSGRPVDKNKLLEVARILAEAPCHR